MARSRRQETVARQGPGGPQPPGPGVGPTTSGQPLPQPSHSSTLHSSQQGTIIFSPIALLHRLYSTRAAALLAACTGFVIVLFFLLPLLNRHEGQGSSTLYSKGAPIEAALPPSGSDLHLLTLVCNQGDADQAKGLFTSLVMQAKQANQYKYHFHIFLDRKFSGYLKMMQSFDKTSKDCGELFKLHLHEYNDPRMPRLFGKECRQEHLAMMQYMQLFTPQWVLFLSADARVLRPLPDIFSELGTFAPHQVLGLVPRVDERSGRTVAYQMGIMLADGKKFASLRVYDRLANKTKSAPQLYRNGEDDVFFEEGLALQSSIHQLPCYFGWVDSAPQSSAPSCSENMPWIVQARTKRSPLNRWYYDPLARAKVAGVVSGIMTVGQAKVTVQYQGCPAAGGSRRALQ